MAPVFNTALKLAIFESRKKQKRIAKLARIPETQLSHIVRGRRTATGREQARLADVLGKTIGELFPGTTTAAHSTEKQLLAQLDDAKGAA
jgi:transcriptional regulator with XRE-family HTH domain